VTDEREVEAMARAAVSEFGRIDVLCNNAGGSIDPKPMLEQSLEGWTRTLAINVTGAFLCAKHIAPEMLAGSRGGRIVNTASILAKQAMAGVGAYVAAKHALLGLTRTLALELGPHGVTCNAVCPGEIATDARVATSPTRYIPLGRLGLPEEVASAIAFLASEEAAYINGQALNVCGGILTY
jgi:NAD(P)-dependent dehydrogenase (short-subunit alcohol dehydrogenase family)